MKTVQKTYHFALRPTKEQVVLLNKHFGCVRFVYNHFLQERKDQYRETKTSDHYKEQAASLTRLKKQEGTEWLGEVNSQSLQCTLRHLDMAYVNFFRGNAELPRFKSKRKKNSFTIPQFVEVRDGKVCFPKFKEGIKLIDHRELQGEVRRCTISKKPTGKFFVSILCEVQYQPLKPTHKAVGIDLGLKDFAVSSDGTRFENSHHLIKYEKQLAKAQKQLSRKVKGSNGWNRKIKSCCHIRKDCQCQT